MNTQAETFTIRFTKPVQFRDQTGVVTEMFNIGDTFEAFGVAETHFITRMGGIPFEYAEVTKDSK